MLFRSCLCLCVVEIFIRVDCSPFDRIYPSVSLSCRVGSIRLSTLLVLLLPPTPTDTTTYSPTPLSFVIVESILNLKSDAPLSQGERHNKRSVTILINQSVLINEVPRTATDLCIRTDDPILDLVKAMYRYF